MYYKKLDIPAVTKNSGLCDEIGQVTSLPLPLMVHLQGFRCCLLGESLSVDGVLKWNALLVYS